VANKGKDNLIPLNQRTKDEQKEITTKGGKASGVARRRKKKLKKEFEDLLKMPVVGKSYLKNLERLGVSTDGSTLQTVMTAALIVQACNGNVKAFEAIKETIEPPKVKADNGEAVTDHLKLMRDAYGQDGNAEGDEGDE